MAGYCPGDRILNRFEIKDSLGNGQLGATLLAIDKHTDNEVALKIIHPSLIPNSDDGVRFINEMRSLRTETNELTVPLLAADHDDRGRCFVVSRLLRGMSLRHLLEKRKGRKQYFSTEEILPIVEQVTDMLRHHSCRVHGALAPERIWILPHQLKITGMGIAKQLPPAAVWYRLRSSATSLHYVAPELEFGTPWNPQIDVFAMGALIAELFTGIPYDGMIGNYKTGNADLDAILAHALDPGIQRRFETPADLLHALTILTDTTRFQKMRSVRSKSTSGFQASADPNEEIETIRDKLPQFPDTVPDGYNFEEDEDIGRVAEDLFGEEERTVTRDDAVLTIVDQHDVEEFIGSETDDSDHPSGKLDGPPQTETASSSETTDQVAMDMIFEEERASSSGELSMDDRSKAKLKTSQGWSHRKTSAIPPPAETQKFPNKRDTDTDELLLEFHSDTNVKEVEVTDSDIELLDDVDEDLSITSTEEISHLSQVEELLELDEVTDDAIVKDMPEEDSCSSALMAVYRLERQAKEAEKDTVNELLRHAERLDGVDPRLVRAAHELETKRRSTESRKAAEILRERAADLDGIDPRLLRAAARLQQSKTSDAASDPKRTRRKEKQTQEREESPEDDWRERMGSLSGDTAVSFLDSTPTEQHTKKKKP